MKAILSNQIEVLYTHLKQRLFASGNPFKRRLVAVPSKILESYLMQCLAQDPDIGIAMGIEFCSHQEAIHRLSKTEHIPTSLELAFGVEQALEELMPEPVSTYLGVKDSVRYFRRRARLSKELAGHFQTYGLYGDEIWKQKKDDWQHALWKQINADPFYRGVNQYENLNIRLEKETEVHFFALSYLAPLHHQFLMEVGKSVPVTYYVISPSCHFWSDLLTDKQSSRHEEEIFERHRLLGNLGSLGRKFARQLEESSIECVGDYVMAPIVEDIETAPDEVRFLKKEKNTLLDHLQADLLLAQERGYTKEIGEDRSISVLVANDAFREVEIVHDKILQLIDEEGISLTDVVVMAPDISLYSCAIESVFGKTVFGIDYQIYDHAKNPLLNCLQRLFKVTEGFWNASGDAYSIIHLLSHPWVSKRAGFDEEDLNQIKKWLKGDDWKHELGILCDSLLEESSISMTQADLLGRLELYLRSLEESARLIQENALQTLSEWALFIEQWVRSFIDLQEEEDLFTFTQMLCRQKINTLFPYLTIKERLIEYLEKRKSVQEGPLHAVRFCSLLPMRALPAKVMVLMGMSQDQFPKKIVNRPLDLLEGTPYAAPSAHEYDRYLFLEAILSAREKLIFTLSVHEETGFALPLIELLSQLDASYSIDGDKISNKIVFNHPSQASDSFYFTKNCPHPSYSERYYRIAKGREKKEIAFYDLFAGKRKEVQEEEEIELTLQDLVRVCKDPLQVFMKEALGVVFKKKPSLSIEERLTLSALDLHAFKQQRSKISAQEAMRLVAKQGKISSGMFKELAQEKVRAAFQEYQELLSEWGIEPHRLESLHLGTSQILPIRIGNAEITGEIEGVSGNRLLIDRKDDTRSIMSSWPLILVFSFIKKACLQQAEIVFLKSGKSYFPDVEKIDEALEKLVNYALRARHQMVPLLPEWMEAFEKGEQEMSKKIKQVALGGDYFYNQTAIWASCSRHLPSITQEQANQWGEYSQEVFGGFELLRKGKIDA